MRSQFIMNVKNSQNGTNIRVDTGNTLSQLAIYVRLLGTYFTLSSDLDYAVIQYKDCRETANSIM